LGNFLAQGCHFSAEMFKRFLPRCSIKGGDSALTKSSRLLRHDFPDGRDQPGKGMTMMRYALALVLASLSAPAMAQGAACAPRDVVVKRLADAYGETRKSMGLGSQGAVIEVFASDTSGSWTITVTGTNGVTCLIAAGQAFEDVADALPVPGNDA
jgi:hypothetical protein